MARHMLVRIARNCLFNPCGHRNSPNVTSFAYQVNNRPMVLAALKMFIGQFC